LFDVSVVLVVEIVVARSSETSVVKRRDVQTEMKDEDKTHGGRAAPVSERSRDRSTI
jgi:hypothetical protein